MQTIHADKWIEGIRPDDGTVDVAVLTLRNRLEAVQHFLPLAAYEADQDVEYVHQLRVWSRRAAAALKLYGEFLPRQRATWVKKQLKRIRRAANDVRNCDVQMMRLSQDAPDEAACRIEKLRAERTKAQKPLMAICEKLENNDRFQRRGRKLLKHVRIRAKATGSSPFARFADWARTGFQPVVEQFFEAVPSDEADEKRLHVFRIRGKKLRYVMEVLAPAFPLEFREELYPIIEALQDKLGLINDLVVSIARLGELPDASAESDEGQSNLQEKERARLDQAREGYRLWWTAALQQNLRSRFDAILGMASIGSIRHTSADESPRRVSPSEAVSDSNNRSIGGPSS